MKCRMPKLPAEGAEVALVAPASPLPDLGRLPNAVAAAERLGFTVRQFPTLTLQNDYMAGTPKQRAKDLAKAFGSKKLEAILCTRGGYSAVHTLPLVDWKAAGRSRKLFTGLSDITTILTALAAKGKLQSLHAPMMGFFSNEKDKAVQKSAEVLKDFLAHGWSGRSYMELSTEVKADLESLRAGRAKGALIGGNAAVFASLVGTPYLPKKGPLILFLEDIGEKPYRLDRYVTQLIQSGFMDMVTGVVLGQFTDCAPKGGDSGTAEEVIARVLAPLKVPILAGLPVGHGKPSIPLPMGAPVTLDAGKKELQVL